MRRILPAVLVALVASEAAAQSLQDLWGADTCDALNEVLAFDPEKVDVPAEQYAEGLAVMSSAYGFLHGYAVANGWHEVDGFDYVSEFRETCAEYPARPPIKILIHLF